MGKASLTAILFAFVFAAQTAAAANLCEALFRAPDEVGQLHAKLIERYSAPLGFLIRNPDAFLARMRDRFEKQKRITPEAPQQFDYTDIAMPVVRDSVKDLTSYIKLLEARVAKTQTSINPFQNLNQRI